MLKTSFITLFARLCPLRFMLLAVTCICSPLAAEVTVIDYLGREVTLAKPAKRIVALAPHIVENLFAAGAGGAVVGAVNYSDYPAEAKAIPRVGEISSFSIEAIVAQKPDLVVVWMSSRGGDALEKIDALGIPTYANDPRALEDVARSIRDYGTLAGTRDEAELAARAYEGNLQTLRHTYRKAQPVSVLYQVWFEPLQTLNDHHIISDVIRLCGGRNIFGDAKTLAPKISLESVLVRDPDFIIASGMGEARPDWLDNWRKWPTLSAVKNKRLHFIPPDIIQRHTPRILLGAKAMCEYLHPELALPTSVSMSLN